MNEEQVEQTSHAPRLRSASRSTLPLASVIEDADTFKEAVKLLKEAIKLKSRMSEEEERLKEIQASLAAISEVYAPNGFRHGLAAFEYHGYTSRRSLNKSLLVGRLADYGAPASLIDECYEAGTPFLSAKILAFDLE